MVKDELKINHSAIKENESRIPGILTKQEQDKQSRWYRGVKNDAEVFYPGQHMDLLRVLVALMFLQNMSITILPDFYPLTAGVWISSECPI